MNKIIRDHNHESSRSTEVNTNMDELVTLHLNLRNWYGIEKMIKGLKFAWLIDTVFHIFKLPELSFFSRLGDIDYNNIVPLRKHIDITGIPGPNTGKPGPHISHSKEYRCI